MSEWSPTKSDCYTPDERATAAQWKGGWAPPQIQSGSGADGSDRKCINGKE